jgi:hypothetical protein
VEWLLRKWQEGPWLRQVNDEWAKDKAQRDRRLANIQQSLQGEKEKTPPQWYVNGQGQTMVVIPGPVELVRPFKVRLTYIEGDNRGVSTNSVPVQVREGVQHKERIGRTFALAAVPVTKEQFLRFHPKFDQVKMSHYPDERDRDLSTYPVRGVSRYEAAAYCNWLSDQEGIAKDQWCYETDARRQVMKLKENYLSLRGYRLPTAAEWEYAARAGDVTTPNDEMGTMVPIDEMGTMVRNMGFQREFWSPAVPRGVGWPTESVWLRRPTDFGLFGIKDYSDTWLQVGCKALRGGLFCFYLAINSDSGPRGNTLAESIESGIGLRPARTLSP